MTGPRWNLFLARKELELKPGILASKCSPLKPVCVSATCAAAPWYLYLPFTKYILYPKPLAHFLPQTCSLPFPFGEWQTPPTRSHPKFFSLRPISILLASHAYFMPKAYNSLFPSLSTQSTTLSPLAHEDGLLGRSHLSLLAHLPPILILKPPSSFYDPSRARL